MLWAVVSLAGGTFQTARNGMARSLSGRLPATLLSWSRFAFNLPLATALVILLYWVLGQGPPSVSARYFMLVGVAALTQLLGNVVLINAFRFATFAQAIVVHKTEVVMAAVVGLVFFAERPSLGAWAGILLSVIGVAMIARATAAARKGGEPTPWSQVIQANRGTGLALVAGALLVVAGYAIRYAGFELADLNPGGGGAFANAASTLFHVTWIEVVILSVWLWLRNRSAYGEVRPNLRRLAAIGATSFAGSLCWFWAFSMAYVALVKAVGQIESVLSVVLAIGLWKEQKAMDQLPGIAVTVVGILLLVLT